MISFAVFGSFKLTTMSLYCLTGDISVQALTSSIVIDNGDRFYLFFSSQSLLRWDIINFNWIEEMSNHKYIIGLHDNFCFYGLAWINGNQPKPFIHTTVIIMYSWLVNWPNWYSLITGWIVRRRRKLSLVAMKL